MMLYIYIYIYIYGSGTLCDVRTLIYIYISVHIIYFTSIHAFDGDVRALIRRASPVYMNTHILEHKHTHSAIHSACVRTLVARVRRASVCSRAA
jgi:hypothetical protein